MSKIYGIRNTDNMYDTHLVIFNRIKIVFKYSFLLAHLDG